MPQVPPPPPVEEYNNQVCTANTQPHFRIFKPTCPNCADVDTYELHQSWDGQTWVQASSADSWDYEPTVATTGYHYLRVRARDVLLRWTGATDTFIWVDVTGPDAPPLQETNNQTWSNTQPHFRISRPDDVGCGGTNHYELYRSWIGNSFFYTTTATSWDYEPNNVSSSGEHYLQAWARDSVGNWGPSTLTWFYFDNIAPASSHVLSPPTPTGDNGWYISPVQVGLSATDTHSGVAAIRYQVDGGGWTTYSDPFTVAGDGHHSVEYFARDVAGNYESPHTATFRSDTTPPQVTIDVPETFWPQVQVSWSATDGTSGLRANPYTVQYRVDDGEWTDWLVNTAQTSATFGPHDPVDVQPGHTYTFRAFAADNAGNVGWSASDAGSTEPVPTLQVGLAPGGPGGDRFLWWASHVPAPGVPIVDRCPRIWGRAWYAYIAAPDQPAAGEEVTITLYAPDGSEPVYRLTTHGDGEFELNALTGGDPDFGATQLGLWSAVASWDPQESGLPVYCIEGDMNWDVEWYIGHVGD